MTEKWTITPLKWSEFKNDLTTSVEAYVSDTLNGGRFTISKGRNDLWTVVTPTQILKDEFRTRESAELQAQRLHDSGLWLWLTKVK